MFNIESQGLCFGFQEICAFGNRKLNLSILFMIVVSLLIVL